ncbi:MAG TPA: O-antigen ligase family protein [Thermoanaerobaculia bacterium]|jgi:O-antigen ligase|nr:O-antigen ligase family protein [Thermoanaerobaculia bacterium]
MTAKYKIRSPAERPQRRSAISKLPWTLAVAATLLVPVAMSLRGQDPFRLPKDLLFIAFSIAIAATAIVVWLRSNTRNKQLSSIRTVPLIAIGSVCWAVLASLFSANHALSNRAILWVAAVAVFACAIDLGGRARGTLAIAWALIPAAINAAIFLLQRFHIWNPMTFPAELPDHMRYTALLGNPDDVGGLLVAPALVAAALVLCDRRRRALWIPIALLLLAAVATGRLTSLLACGAGLLVMGFVRSRKAGAIATALILVAGIALVVGDPPLRARATSIASSVRAHDYAEATAGRLTAFVAASMMAMDHPLFGVGPGCFRWSYFEYKVAAERKHPSLAKAWSADFNFGETHNDHLQTLAEGGLPGYALFAAALVLLAASSRRKKNSENANGNNEETERDTLVRMLAVPTSAAIAILCLAHFPLHLAASTVVIIYIATLCVAWGAHAELKVSPALNERLASIIRPRGLPAALSVALVVVVVIGAAFLIRRIALQPWQCNLSEKVIQARTSLTYDSVTDPIQASHNAHENLAALEPCLEAAPQDIALYMLAAANDRLIGRDADAATMYRRALQYDRRPELYYNLGVVELQLHQRDAAIADLLTAVSFSRAYLQDLPADVQAEIRDGLKRQYPYLAGS